MKIKVWRNGGNYYGTLEDEGMVILSISTPTEETTKHLLMALTQCHMQCIHASVMRSQNQPEREFDA